MTEVYNGPFFDQQVDKLLIGETAIEQRLLEEGGQDLVPLAQLLITDTFDAHQYSSVEKLDGSGWTKEDYCNHGKWLLHVLKQYDPSLYLKREHLERSYSLGLAPSWFRMAKLIDEPRFNGYRAKVYTGEGYELPSQHRPFTKYYEQARRLHGKLKRKLTIEDFDQDAAENPEKSAPGRLIANRMKIGQLNEYIGYPDFGKWQKKSRFIRWGVDVMFANDGIELTPTILELYTGESKGPSVTLIKQYCTSWANFKKDATEQYFIEKRERAEKIARYTGPLAAYELPKSITGLSANNFLKAAGMYTLVKYLFPEQNGRLEKFAHQSFEHVILRLIESDPELTEEYIVNEAHRLGVFEDIVRHRETTSGDLSIHAMVEHCISRGDLKRDLESVGLSRATISVLFGAILTISDPVSQVLALNGAMGLANNMEKTEEQLETLPLREQNGSRKRTHQHAVTFLNHFLERDTSGLNVSQAQLKQFLIPTFDAFQQLPNRSTALTGRTIANTWAYMSGDKMADIAKRNGVSKSAVEQAQERLSRRIKERLYQAPVLCARFRQVLTDDQLAIWDRLA